MDPSARSPMCRGLPPPFPRTSCSVLPRHAEPDSLMNVDDDLELQDEGTNAEDMDSDLDSAIEDMEPPAQPDLLSITSDIFDYQFENGRSYHSMSEGKYAYPNDDLELIRYDLQHHLWLITLDGELATSPGRETARRVLDLGTGTGIWAIDFADAYPGSEVIGVDLSAIQPDLVPANCSFEIDDLELDWPWEQPFDYIFNRSCAGSWSDFRSMIQRAYDHLEPGGYFEVQDLELPSYCDDGSVPPDAALYRWQHALVDASNEVGRPINYAVDCLDDLQNVGFVEIHHQIYKWPFNNWPEDPKLKEAGRWNCANLDMGLEAFSLGLLTRVKGWTRDAVEELCTEVKKEVKDTRLHAYWRQ
ncbi:methyltransferase domain-containing protein [Colletotrichum nymphaeae SA-01]|uniref:Methyltransferase domain-containing protein n=1 Tax=Colletotrichum nymphaeae SA-01 TaxID=1460502 RepID=A0A135SN06_9PEZI|nr:methyltransferase domain-containing protein [Colletotrichum nymphaeae SA-01]